MFVNGWSHGDSPNSTLLTKQIGNRITNGTMSESNQVRWGILSTAGIAAKNWRAILRAENATLVAVASRSLESANFFIDRCQSTDAFEPRPKAHANYDELIARDDIDAIYMPLPTGTRKEWILKAVRTGKHVLAEKPAALSAEDVEEIIAACQENNVQYMDGVMFMHSARLEHMRQTLDDGQSIGNIKRISSVFSFNADEDFRKNNIRTKQQVEPFGCLGDLGWYNARIILWALNWQNPTQVIGRTLGTFSGTGSTGPVPSQFSAELQFADGCSAGFYCSFEAEHQQWTVISGDRGFLRLDDFVLPFYGPESEYTVFNNDFHVDGCNYDARKFARREAVAEYANGRANSQETNMFRTFSTYVTSGNLEPIWGRRTLQTQKVIDKLMISAANGGSPVEF
jgi:predicted dehydrogenase